MSNALKKTDALNLSGIERAMKFWAASGFFCLTFLFSWQATAAETYELDSEHRGVLYLGDYQIFPENRLGNALYYKYKLLISVPDRQILKFYEIPETQSLVYLYADAQQALALDVYDFSEEKESKIKRVDNEFYEVWLSGNRKIFRIYQNDLVGLTSHLKTATGLTPSHSHIAYYHIESSEVVSADDEAEHRIYYFRIHVMKRSDINPIKLSEVIQDTQASLKLTWIDARTLSYRLSDGTSHEIDVASQLPDYF